MFKLVQRMDAGPILTIRWTSPKPEETACELHDRLAGKGVEILEKIDYGYTRSFYFNDPDGNRVEVYCDLKAPLESKRFLAERPGSGQPFEFAAPS